MTPSKTICRLIFLGVALLALFIRLPQLAERPMHTDESVNAYITGNLLAGEPFRYDSNDKHGPVLFLFAKPIAQLCGATKFSELTEIELRLTPVIIGSLMILLFGVSVEMFGFIPCLVAALLFAVAPLPVYYSRYFIHETLFVAVTYALILSGWQVLKKNSPSYAALAGLCAALLLACKETAVIHFFAMAMSLFCLWVVNRRNARAFHASSTQSARQHPAEASLSVPSVPTAFTAGLAFLAVAFVCFTWFGRNFAALTELIQAVPRFTARAQGQGHEKSLGYYFSILDFTLVLYLLAAAGIFSVLCEIAKGKGRANLTLLIYGLFILVIYSVIPYKQPWLALNLWLPFALICGFGVEAILNEIKDSSGRWLVLTSGLVLLAALGMETKSLVFQRPADEKNPFAYAHTSDDILGLPEKIHSLCDSRKIAKPIISVIASDAWPLPWYLRKFSQVGFWQPGQKISDANFYITIGSVDDGLTNRLEHFRADFFQVRPGVLLQLWSPPKTEPAK